MGAGYAESLGGAMGAGYAESLGGAMGALGSRGGDLATHALTHLVHEPLHVASTCSTVLVQPGTAVSTLTTRGAPA